MMLLDGRVVLVSGTGPGLGSETARAVLREGGRVVLGDRLDRVESLRADLDPSEARSVAVVGDITDLARCEALVQAAAERFGRLDAVVNVAAVDTVFGGLMSGSLDDWDVTAGVNVRGTLQLTKAAVPLLEASGGGAVVFIGSIGAVQRDESFEMMLYGATKGAMVTAAWYLARELGPRGIRVNTVAPGYKWGPVLEHALQEQAASMGVDIDEVAAPIRDSIALRRIPTDSDVANAIVFFCSDLARSITGQTLFVDGGHGHIMH
jgi:NAD(P)-dependent dehydrogenase (short-subunit alcohol dehydrogenase family)